MPVGFLYMVPRWLALELGIAAVGACIGAVCLLKGIL
jgi:hypothetical protein